MLKKIFILLSFFPFQLLLAQSSQLTDFPEGYTPEEVGKRLAYRFVDGKHALHAGKWISYPETFNWNGALQLAKITKDKKLFKLLENKLHTIQKCLINIFVNILPNHIIAHKSSPVHSTK